MNNFPFHWTSIEDKVYLLLQLHQYPGYDPRELTTLPDDVPVHDMLEKAALAHVQLHKKV